MTRRGNPFAWNIDSHSDHVFKFLALFDVDLDSGQYISVEPLTPFGLRKSPTRAG